MDEKTLLKIQQLREQLKTLKGRNERDKIYRQIHDYKRY